MKHSKTQMLKWPVLMPKGIISAALPSIENWYRKESIFCSRALLHGWGLPTSRLGTYSFKWSPCLLFLHVHSLPGAKEKSLQRWLTNYFTEFLSICKSLGRSTSLFCFVKLHSLLAVINRPPSSDLAHNTYTHAHIKIWPVHTQRISPTQINVSVYPPACIGCGW